MLGKGRKGKVGKVLQECLNARRQQTEIVFGEDNTQGADNYCSIFIVLCYNTKFLYELETAKSVAHSCG